MPRMIIVTRNGQTRVLTGWRAWLTGTLGLVIAWGLLLLITSVVIGVSLTLGVVLLLALPALLGVGLVAQALRGRR